MNLCVHLADISNPTKRFPLYKQWTELLFVEFFAQGDLERSRSAPISYMMDRTTTNIAKSQIGFIEFIVQPSFEIMKLMLPSVEENLLQMAKNKVKWTGMIPEYEDKMAEERNRLAAAKSEDTVEVSSDSSSESET